MAGDAQEFPGRSMGLIGCRGHVRAAGSFSMRTAVTRPRLLGAVGIVALAAITSVAGASRFPDPARDTPRAAARDPQTAVLAGGCFWGVEAVFEELEGVADVSSGYAGGNEKSAHYEMVSTGQTGHAESVKITYDASQISYGQLLKVFFSVAHDPTQLNRQGPDEGTQYRSTIFYANDEQKQVATAYIAQLNAAKVFKKPIVTTVVPLQGFFLAEAHHQNFLKRNPTYPYIVYNDLPKLEALKSQLPELLKKKGGTK
jgi:peptide-methionine (S)-S-oxide reductase